MRVADILRWLPLDSSGRETQSTSGSCAVPSASTPFVDACLSDTITTSRPNRSERFLRKWGHPLLQTLGRQPHYRLLVARRSIIRSAAESSRRVGWPLPY